MKYSGFMKFDCDAFNQALTEWLVAELDRRGIPHAVFSRDSGLQKGSDGRVFRSAKTGTRKWTVADLCKVAAYFNETPSGILKKAEGHLKTPRST